MPALLHFESPGEGCGLSVPRERVARIFAQLFAFGRLHDPQLIEPDGGVDAVRRDLPDLRFAASLAHPRRPQ